MVASPTPEIALSVQSMGAMAPQQIAALAQQQQLQNGAVLKGLDQISIAQSRAGPEPEVSFIDTVCHYNSM